MRARKTNLRPTEIDSNEHTQSYRTHITVGISTQINMKIEQYLNYHLIFLRSQKWMFTTSLSSDVFNCDLVIVKRTNIDIDIDIEHQH